MIFLMKKTILQYMTDIYQEDIPKHILQENKIRLNSFFLEQESVQKKGTQFIFRYAFYSVEKPRKITKQHLLKEYAGVPLEKRSVQPEQIPDMKQYSDIILYGDASSPEAQQQLAEYLQQHNSLKVQLSFFDKRNDSTSKDEQAIAYAELQKALFFCQRKKIPLLFVSLKGMIDDIRFLNLLEESHVDFRCIDFPWFCKENLPLIKAVVLYEKLEIRINCIRYQAYRLDFNVAALRFMRNNSKYISVWRNLILKGTLNKRIHLQISFFTYPQSI